MTFKHARQNQPAKSKDAPAPTIQPRLRANEGIVEEIPLLKIAVGNRNDRLLEPGDAERELAESMASRGLLEPIVVGIVGDQGGAGGAQEYQLVAGHRRLAAAKLLKWEMIRATVRIYADDDELQLDRATENIHRLDLNPVEEAYAVGGMIEAALPAVRREMVDAALGSKALASDDIGDVRYVAQARRRAIEMVANKLGKSVTWVTDRSFLSLLPEDARDLVLEGRLPMNHAREICKVADPRRRTELAKRFAAGKKHGDRPGDFSDLRSEVADNLMSLAQVPWKLDTPFAGAPACQSCPKNSANQPRLFEHIPPSSHGTHYGHESFKEPAAGVCTDKVCFSEKKTQANRQLAAKAGTMARRLKEVPKSERPEVTAKVIDGLGRELKVDVPRFLDPSQVASRVKEEMARGPERASKPKSGPVQPAKRTAEDEAKLKARGDFWDALYKRQTAIEKRIVTECARDPLKRAALAVVTESPLWSELSATWSGASNSQRKRAKNASEKAGMQQLINLVANPSLEGFRMAGEFIRCDGIGYRDIEPTTDIIDRLAKALGIDVPPRPVLEEPKPAAKAEPEPKGKKTRSGKKASRGVTTQDLDDLEESES